MWRLAIALTLLLTSLAARALGDPPTPVFWDHCQDELLRRWVAVGGTTCANAPIRIWTAINTDPSLPEVEASQEADGSYNVTIISVPNETSALNHYIVEVQQSGIAFNVLRVVRRTTSSSHPVTLTLSDDLATIDSINMLGEIVLDGDGTEFTFTPLQIGSAAELAVVGDIGYVASSWITTLRIGGNLGREEQPSGGVVREYVNFLEVGVNSGGGHLLGQFAVEGMNTNGQSIQAMTIQGRMGLEDPDPEDIYELAAGDIRTAGTIGQLQAGEVGPEAEITVGYTGAGRQAIGKFDVTPEFGGSGDFHGFLYAATLDNGSSSHQARVLGDFYGRFEFEDALTDHDSTTPAILIDGAFKSGARIFLPASGLEGQVIINRANIDAAWQSNAKVIVDSTELTSATYAAAASEIGGGAVGRAEFRLHRESCDPTNELTGDPPTREPGVLHVESHLELDVGGVNWVCVAGPATVFMQFYGPISVNTGSEAPDRPVKLHRWTGTSWSVVTGFSVSAAPGGDRKRLALTLGNGFFGGSYRVTREPNGLFSDHVNEVSPGDPAGVNAFTYYFDVVIDSCEGMLLAGFDFNSDDDVSEPGDLPAWLVSPVDLTNDALINSDDITSLQSAAALYGQSPSTPVYYPGPYEDVE